MNEGVITVRCDTRASHIRNKKKSAPIREIIDPIEDTVFHVV